MNIVEELKDLGYLELASRWQMATQEDTSTGNVINIADYLKWPIKDDKKTV